MRSPRFAQEGAKTGLVKRLTGIFGWIVEERPQNGLTVDQDHDGDQQDRRYLIGNAEEFRRAWIPVEVEIARASG